jgi:hypothetical protein
VKEDGYSEGKSSIKRCIETARDMTPSPPASPFNPYSNLPNQFPDASGSNTTEHPHPVEAEAVVEMVKPSPASELRILFRNLYHLVRLSKISVFRVWQLDE